MLRHLYPFAHRVTFAGDYLKTNLTIILIDFSILEIYRALIIQPICLKFGTDIAGIVLKRISYTELRYVE